MPTFSASRACVRPCASISGRNRWAKAASSHPGQDVLRLGISARRHCLGFVKIQARLLPRKTGDHLAHFLSRRHEPLSLSPEPTHLVWRPIPSYLALLRFNLLNHICVLELPPPDEPADRP